jgi:hypothetical protein
MKTIFILIALFVSGIFAGDSVTCSNKTINGIIKITAPCFQSGIRSKPSVMRCVMVNLSKLRKIYTEFLRAGSRFEGKVVLMYSIDSRGKVLSSAVDSTNIVDTLFINKIIDNIKSWEFKPISSIRDTTVVKYGFVFALPRECKQDDSVLTAETAIKIAVDAWEPIYGKKQIEKEKPYVAILKDSIWFVTGSLPTGWVGGTAKAEILNRNGKILKIYHEK